MKRSFAVGSILLCLLLLAPTIAGARGLDYCPGHPLPDCAKPGPGCACVEQLGQTCPGQHCHLCIETVLVCGGTQLPVFLGAGGGLSCPDAGDPFLCWRQIDAGPDDDLGQVGHLLEASCWEVRVAVPGRDGGVRLGARWVDGCQALP